MPDCDNLHAIVDQIADDFRNRLHMLVTSAESRLAADMQWHVTADRQRTELTELRAANRAYARTLTCIREALNATEDADLEEAIRRLQSALFNATEQGNALMREHQRLEREIERLRTEREGRRKALEQVGEERRREWTRAERAEAERDGANAPNEQLDVACDQLRQDLADARTTLSETQAALDYFKDGDATRDLMAAVAKLRAIDAAFGAIAEPAAIHALVTECERLRIQCAALEELANDAVSSRDEAQEIVSLALAYQGECVAFDVYAPGQRPETRERLFAALREWRDAHGTT